MFRTSTFLLACTLLLCLPAFAQTAPPHSTSVHCTVQPAAPSTDASRAYASGDFASAERLYTAQLSAHPALSAYEGLAHAQLQQNRLTEARATAERALAAPSAQAEAQALLGEVLLRSGQISPATAAFTRAMSLDSCSAQAIFGIGTLNELTSRHAAAAIQYKIAHSIAPHNPEYTAAYLRTLPVETRAEPLKALLASSPELPPAALEHLRVELAALEQHTSCTVNDAGSPVKVDLYGLMTYGTHPRSWGFRIRVNNAELPLAELDSGVSGIVLNPRDARAAGVHPLLASTPAPGSVYYAVADKIRVGALEYRDCVVRVAPADTLANANSLIGTDFFRDRLIHIDYVDKRLTLTPYPQSPSGDRSTAAAPKGWSPVYIAGSNLLVPTLINKKGPLLFLLATGASSTVLAPDIANKQLLSYRDSQLHLRGTSAAIVKTIPQVGGGDEDDALVHGATGALLKVSIPVKLPYLTFTGHELLEQDAISYDISAKSHDTGVELAGLLGFSLLDQFYIDIDYRDGLIKLDFDPNHLYVTRELDRHN